MLAFVLVSSINLWTVELNGARYLSFFIRRKFEGAPPSIFICEIVSHSLAPEYAFMPG